MLCQWSCVCAGEGRGGLLPKHLKGSKFKTHPRISTVLARMFDGKSTIRKPLSVPTSADPRTMTRDILGVIDLVPTCGSEPGVGGVRSAVVGSPLSAQSVLLRKAARMRVASFATACFGPALAPSLFRITCYFCQNADRHPRGTISLPRALRVRSRCLRWLSGGIRDPPSSGRTGQFEQVRVGSDIQVLKTSDIPFLTQWVSLFL